MTGAGGPVDPPAPAPVSAAVLSARGFRLRAVPFSSLVAAWGPPALRWAPMLALVALATALVAVAFDHAPVVPGVDPGHWLSVSYSYVGLPTAPDPTDRVLSYPPLMFPFLGALVVIFGNPIPAAETLALGLYAGFGLSLLLLARRFLVTSALRTALVGLGLFTGSTLQMLFWGGYPNLLGFLLLNLTVVAFVGYLRRPTNRQAAFFFAGVALTFFAHDLTFAILLGILALVSFLLLVLRRMDWRFLFRRANLIGGACLVGVFAGYSALTSWLQIPHPGYFRTNPAAFSIDNLGELFAPLGRAPALWPQGPSLYLPSTPLAIALLAAPLVALASLGAVRHLAPRYCDTRLVVATGWLAAAMAVPAAGYAAHVDTDYTRFLYFLPLPFVLLVLLGVERGFLARLVPGATAAFVAPTAPAERPAPDPRTSPAAPRPWNPVAVWAAVAIVLGFVFTTVTVPVVEANEASGTAAAHDASFLAAMHWLRAQPRDGAVLTVPSAARWTEALSLHNALAVGPVWLLFDQFQITDSQEAYWELSASKVLSNGAASWSFSGFATAQFSQAPMYTAYIDAVEFPVFRVLPGSLAMNVTTANGTYSEGFEGNVTVPVLTGPGPDGATVDVRYVAPAATLDEICTVRPDGSAGLTFAVSPVGGAVVHSLSLTLATPPSASPTLATDRPTQLKLAGSTLSWGISGRLGQSPVPADFTTTVRFQPAPWSLGPAVISGPHTWTLTIPDPNGSAPFSAVANVTTAGASNPTHPLPTYLDTGTLLTNQSIRYLLWPIGSSGSSEPAYFAATHGFHVAFANPEWEILAA